MTLDKNDIYFRASRIIWACRVYPRILMGALAIKVWASGQISLSLVGLYIICAVIVVFIFSLFPVRRFDFIIKNNKIIAPVGRALFSKSIEIDLSDIVVSESLIDKLTGMTLRTKSGHRINVSSLHHSRIKTNQIKEHIIEKHLN